jgi:hypothetical protein
MKQRQRHGAAQKLVNKLSVFSGTPTTNYCVHKRPQAGSTVWHFATCPTPKLVGSHLSKFSGGSFNTTAVILHICKPSPPTATRGRAMPWRQGTL